MKYKFDDTVWSQKKKEKKNLFLLYYLMDNDEAELL
jgi:hypothetical protein